MTPTSVCLIYSQIPVSHILNRAGWLHMPLPYPNPSLPIVILIAKPIKSHNLLRSFISQVSFHVGFSKCCLHIFFGILSTSSTLL